jgi:hypothetical protein
MTTVTLNTDEALLAKAKKVLEKRGQTLDSFFSSELVRLTDGELHSQDYRELMASLKHVNSGGKFTREEMNER